jgi:diacylglycerol kinase (ATP)
MSERSRGLHHLVRALGCATTGLGWALRREEAFRVEAVLFVILVPAAILLGESGLARALLVASLVLVLVLELVNTALEVTVDRIGLEHHPLSARAKDVASAAVSLAMLNVVLVWGFVLLG